MEAKKHENAPVCMLCGQEIVKTACVSDLANHLYYLCPKTRATIPTRVVCPCGHSWHFNNRTRGVAEGSALAVHFLYDVTVEQHLLRMIQK
jgi:hypothetical protein